jgi:hypothetical protein
MYSCINWKGVILVSRNKLYNKRMELCLTPEQHKIVKELAKKNNRRMNEIVREAIMRMWEQK